VPGSAEKSELSAILERIPVHCQQLQVDSVIQETKNLMNEIAKLVTSSFVCATKANEGEGEGVAGGLPVVVVELEVVGERCHNRRSLVKDRRIDVKGVFVGCRVIDE
ncbi:hypothetical protein TELCIR_16230, partial [Teladorsagia circumcincta]